MKYSNVGTRCYIAQRDYSGVLSAFDLRIRQPTTVITSYRDDGPRRVIGPYDVALKMTGFFDAVTANFDGGTFLNTTGGSPGQTYVSVCPGTDVEGSRCIDFLARPTARPIRAQVGRAILESQDLAASSGLGDVKTAVLANLTATGNGVRTGRDLGASAAGRTFRAIVRAISGTFTSFTVSLEHSDDDGALDAYAVITEPTIIKSGSEAPTQSDTMAVSVDEAFAWVLRTAGPTKAYKRVRVADWIGTDAQLVVTAGTLI